MALNFRALVVREEDGRFVRRIEERATDDLPPGDVLIRVLYSSLNYKDALSAIGNRGVTRSYPHTPGIDAAGIVEEAAAGSGLAPGDEVVVIGYNLGMDTPGGFGQYIRVPAGWVVRRPEALSLAESMAYGTAGFTAAQAVDKLLAYGVQPEQGEVVVTGATGGVGVMAVALLAQQGFEVVAVTGKLDQSDLLADLGAAAVVARDVVDDQSGRALLKERWAAAVDTVGGNMLATLIKSTRKRGAVAACGNAASGDLNLTVYPFILRGVALFGIDSGNADLAERGRIWGLLAGPWRVPAAERLARPVPLAALDAEIDRILAGGQVGRVVVDLWG